MLQSVELFSGSGQVSKLFEEFGFSKFRVDFNQKFETELCIDICNLTKDKLPGTVQLFWASPDCTCFSRAGKNQNWHKKTISYRNYEYTPLTSQASKSLDLVARTVDLIKNLKPVVWFIENPVGRIHHTSALRSIGHYRYFVNYCDYGFPYSKETYIFTNQLLSLPVSSSKRHIPGLRSICGKFERSLIPPDLIRFLISHSQF